MQMMNFKKLTLSLLIAALAVPAFAQNLPRFTGNIYSTPDFDWLLAPEKVKSDVWISQDGKSVIIGNQLIAREFLIEPNLASVRFVNRMTGENMLRRVSSEGGIKIDGKEYSIGGLAGQPEGAYLKPEWIGDLSVIPDSFIYKSYEVAEAGALLNWKRNRWALNTQDPSGKEVIFTMTGPEGIEDVTLKVHFAVYDALPVIRKWIEVENGGNHDINIDSFKVERLYFVESALANDDVRIKFSHYPIHVESSYEGRGDFSENIIDATEKWVTDPEFTSQKDYGCTNPCILEVAPSIGPDQTLAPGQKLTTIDAFEMPYDSYDRERTGLFTRRFYRTIAPWTTQNPIFLHLTSSDSEQIRKAVDQCVETGYEMVIISFGSGLNMEDISDENIAKYRELVEYAESKGIELGCYSLLASRKVSEDVDVISPKTGKTGSAWFGNSPCIASDWGWEYFYKLKTFLEKTGIKCLEHDGSYPGDVCASTTHSHHKGLNDSQWVQFHKITEFYHWLLSEGYYSNVPDFYFLNGTTKVGIGYKEVNWSLPRDRQLMHTRQLNYDCTWERPQSALWSFVPLTQYHGGGAPATIEPLDEHLFEYKTLMFQNYSSGVQACYRGPRLYDTPRVKEAVIEVISWYKKYRTILNSDIIHLRRPDAQDWDGLLHVNSNCKEKGLAILYNPLDKEIVREITLPLYYTGLTKSVMIREQEGKAKRYTLDREYNVTLTVTIPANGYTWFVIE